MMSPLRFLTLLSLLLLVRTNARKWPDAVEHFAASKKQDASSKVMEKSDCHSSLDTNGKYHFPAEIGTGSVLGANRIERSLAKDFDTELNISAFYGDEKSKENSLMKDFDTEPNISAFYGDGKQEEKSSGKDFDTEPNISAFYGDSKSEGNSLKKDFDTEPNISAFYGDGKPKDNSAVVEFETKPSVTAFHGNPKAEEKSYAKGDFKPEHIESA